MYYSTKIIFGLPKKCQLFRRKNEGVLFGEKGEIYVNMVLSFKE